MSAGRNRTRHVQAHATGRIPAPCAGVGNIRRIGKSAGNAKYLVYPFVGADGRLPIISARTVRYFPRVSKVAHTEIKIDTSYCSASSGTERDFSSRLSWQLDARHRDAGVERAECCFDGATNGRLMVGQCRAPIDVIGRDTAPKAEFKLIGLATRGDRRTLERRPAVAPETDRAAIVARSGLPQCRMIGNEQRPHSCNCNCEDGKRSQMPLDQFYPPRATATLTRAMPTPTITRPVVKGCNPA